MSASELALFRPEALRQRSDSNAGKPLRLGEGSDARFAWTLSSLAAGLLVAATAVPIGTTLSATGMVSPQTGFTYVVAPLSGYVVSAQAEDGAPVRQAQPVLTLRADYDDSEGSARVAAARSLDLRLQVNRSSRERSITAVRKELVLAREEEAQAGRSIANLTKQVELQARRIALQSDQLKLEERHVAEGYMAKSWLVIRRDALMDQQQRREALEHSLWEVTRAQTAARSRIQQLTAKLAGEEGELTSAEEGLKQQQRENRARAEAIVLAPRGGTFDSYRVAPGSYVREGQALGAVHDRATTMAVELFVPATTNALPEAGMSVSVTTRMAGYMGASKRVLRGRVARVASVAAPGRSFAHLPVNLVGDQSYFRVYVQLDGNTGTPPLQPGTVVDASIELARRTFAQSILLRATPGT